jgi:putative membrane protein
MMRGYGFNYGTPYGMMGGGGWVVGLLMLGFFLLVLVGVILLVVWAVRSASGHGHAGPTGPHAMTGHEEALAIAKKRLASGEITPEQFEEIRKTLGS